MIVKVQRSLTTTAKEPRLLIYNYDRSIRYECPESEARDVRAALGDDLKGHFKAKLRGTIVEIGKRVPDRNW